MSEDDSIVARERQIVEEFGYFEDWMGKYEYLIEQGRTLPLLDAQYKDDAHKIHGCQSQVWVRAEQRNGRVYFTADSDAMITKGLVALLIRVLDGQPPEAILSTRLDFIDAIGLQEHLSSTRRNGLSGMIKQMKRYALTHAAQN